MGSSLHAGADEPHFRRSQCIAAGVVEPLSRIVTTSTASSASPALLRSVAWSVRNLCSVTTEAAPLSDTIVQSLLCAIVALIERHVNDAEMLHFALWALTDLTERKDQLRLVCDSGVSAFTQLTSQNVVPSKWRKSKKADFLKAEIES